MASIAVPTLLASVTAPQRSAAQEEDPFAGVEQMVVVGTSAAALMQSVEVSVIGFDADYLEALGASDLSDVAQFTPNLEIRTPFAASNPTLFIRGVGLRDFNANSSSSVAVYNDDIYMNSPAGQLSQLFDVENVDVLRGPQGGIYGRNASAGAIRVISRKPTGTNSGYVNVTYGRFEQVDIQTAAETPLIEDVLTLRISGKMSRRGGTTKNRCGDPNYADNPNEPPLQSFQQRVHNFCFNPTVLGNPLFGVPGWEVGRRPPVKERVNDVNNWASRALLRWQPDVLDGMDWLLNIHGGQNRGDARQFQMLGAEQGQLALKPTITRSIATRDRSGYIDPDNQFRTPGNTGQQLDGLPQSPFRGDPFEGDYNNVEKEILDLFGASLVGDITVDDWTFKTVTGYEWNHRDVELNLDGNPYETLEPVLRNSSYQVTQEVRAAWDQGSGLTAQVAAMFLYEGLNVDNEFALQPTDSRKQSYTMWTRYGSVFGDLSWEPGEMFSLKGGMRLNYEEKEMNLHLSQALDPLSGSVIFETTENSKAEEFGLAGDVTLSYLPTSDVTFYLKYAHGWKGPHINGGVSSPTSTSQSSLLTPVKPEQIDSFELGVKSLWRDSSIKVNGALFYYDYNDIQVFRLRNSSGSVPVNELISAQDADILGVELDVDVRPFDGIGPEILSGFNVFASFAWLDSHYTDFVNVVSATQDRVVGGVVQPVVTQATFDYSGAQLINSPEFAFVGFAQWIMPTPYGSITPRFDWSFKDDIFFGPENSELLGQSALWLLNMRVTYIAPTENLEISGWVENLTDQAYTVDAFNLALFRRSILYAIGDPRTYGVSLRMRF